MKTLSAAAAVIAAAAIAAPCAAADAPLPMVKQYAFPTSWVAAKQTWVQRYWPAAGCRGRNPVDLVGGGRGYRFIECIDELDNPPTTIWFRINSSGHVVMELRKV